MKKQEQEEHFDRMVSAMKDTLIKKGNDYANEDRLSNFKKAGSICGLKPELNCLSLIATKVARLGVLLNSENSPNNESIRDSILDLANYAVLLDMIVSDGMDNTAVFIPTPNDSDYLNNRYNVSLTATDEEVKELSINYSKKERRR